MQPVGDPGPGHQYEEVAAVRAELRVLLRRSLPGGRAGGCHRGRHPGPGVGTSVKHYAANNQESDRLRVDAQIDERSLREIYLPAFERVVTGSQPWTIMCAYNKVNGQSASENTWLLTTVLREEFGFEGLVVSDWGAVYHRVPALLAGLDLEMPPALGRSPEAVVAAVKAGEVSTEVLDARVRTVLELVAKGMPVLELDESFDPEAHHALAREAAAESVVLLKNDGLLPSARRCQDRGGWRIRAHPAVPRCGVVPGDADPGGRAAGGVAGGVRGGAFCGGLRDRRHGR